MRKSALCKDATHGAPYVNQAQVSPAHRLGERRRKTRPLRNGPEGVGGCMRARRGEGLLKGGWRGVGDSMQEGGGEAGAAGWRPVSFDLHHYQT